MINSIFFDKCTNIPIGSRVKRVQVALYGPDETAGAYCLDEPDKTDPTNNEIILVIQNGTQSVHITLQRPSLVA